MMQDMFVQANQVVACPHFCYTNYVIFFIQSTKLEFTVAGLVST